MWYLMHKTLNIYTVKRGFNRELLKLQFPFDLGTVTLNTTTYTCSNSVKCCYCFTFCMILCLYCE